MKVTEPIQSDLDKQHHSKVANPSAIPKKSAVGSFSFFLKTLIYGTIAYYVTNQFAPTNLWVLILSVFFVSMPIILCGMYSSTIRQIRRLAIFKKKGWIFRIASSRFLTSILWVLWALGSAFFMLIQFYTYSQWEWGIFLLVIPFFWGIFRVCRNFIAREIVAYLATDIALRWTRMLCPLFMLVLYFLVLVQFEALPKYASIAEAIDAQQSRIEHLAGSAITREASQFLALYEGIKAYVLGLSGLQDTFSEFILLAVSKLVVFFNACAVLSCFVIPSIEYRRILGPLSDAETPSPLSASRIATVSAIFTFLTIFIYTPLFIYLEAWVQQRSTKMNEDREKIEQIAVDLIGDETYKKGTIEKLHKAKLNALPDIEVIQMDLEEKLNIGFQRLESRVDNYLDWYYSLTGEYTRLSKLLIGQLEEDMKRRFQEALEQGGNPFEEYEAAVNSLLSQHEEAQKAYVERAHNIMQKNRIELTDTSFGINNQVSMMEALSLPVHQDNLISLEQRIGGGSAAGAVTAIIVGKIAGKSIFKLAVSLLSKTIASKAAGAAVSAGTGAAAGAAIGSFVPGLGTAIGAVIGGIAGGVAIGITVDKTLIELEEAVSREKFKNEILFAINETHMEFKEKLREKKE
ncbi:hypothetical protein [Nitrosomonas communis]|uniref:hypothetical protein n=1 Tax=Nitrosomonas communis TaxID=44574 RepID=UPI0011152FB3|nr:hypothetical protein [Nitrosomonas communis]